jgi:CDP-diacylglycerol--glycerol-3-phosphate 3-phosphatidyltransferase
MPTPERTTEKPHAQPVSPSAGTRSFKRQVPNLLTIVRLILAAVVFVLLAGVPHDAFAPFSVSRNDATQALLLAAAIFVIAAITDAADGYFARRWNAVSAFGRVMDPFADKILILGTVILMAAPPFLVREPAPTVNDGTVQLTQAYMHLGFVPWMVVVILARELLVTSLRGVYETRGVSFPSVWSGKLKMVLQCVGLPAALVIGAIMDVEPDTTGRGILLAIAWTTTLVTAWSGVPYVWAAITHELKNTTDTQANSKAPTP